MQLHTEQWQQSCDAPCSCYRSAAALGQETAREGMADHDNIIVVVDQEDASDRWSLQCSLLILTTRDSWLTGDVQICERQQ